MSGTDYTQTPNLGLYKPIPNADNNAWGVHWNTNADTLDSLLATGSGGTFLPLTGGTVSGATTFSGATGNALTVSHNAVVNGTGFAFQVPNGSILTGSSTTAGGVRVEGPAGTNRETHYNTGGTARWAAGAGATTEAGNNQGSEYRIDAYNDDGSFAGNMFSANRRSGPLQQGAPNIYVLAPYRQINPLATQPGGVLANDQEFLSNGDVQPTVALGANPLSVTNGSTTVTVTWTNSVGGNQIQSVFTDFWDCWVLINGATAVGGITLSGWYQVTSTVDNDHFTIQAATAATSTVTGGGSSCTIQPSFVTQVNKTTTTIKTSGSGFPLMNTELLNIDPYVLQPAGTAYYPRYGHRWHWTVGPVDNVGDRAWSVAAIEWDLTNRGADVGYAPDLYHAGAGMTVAYWIGPTDVPSWATGGGTATNWNTVYSVYQTNGHLGVYDAFSNQANSLVGAARDPTGHGGVAFDSFGSRNMLRTNLPPFTTTVGTSTVTVTLANTRQMPVQVNGNSVYIPGPPQTVNGVTFGGGDYVIANIVNDISSGSNFTIQGTGTATVSGNGGTGSWVAFANLVPYAPFHYHGSYKHGLISSPNSRVESGAIVETQPGNAMLWTDGTGNATINGTSLSTGNIGIALTPSGTGVVTSLAPLTIGNSATQNALTIAPGATTTASPITMSMSGTGSFTFNGQVTATAPGGSPFVSGSNTAVGAYLINGPAANTNRSFQLQTLGVLRWRIASDGNAEPIDGSNAGANLAFYCYSDTGVFIGTPLQITRATMQVVTQGSLRVGLGAVNALVITPGATAATAIAITQLGTGGISITPPVTHVGTIGFNNTAPIAKPTVTGAKGSNAALASLMTALAAYGLVTDSTTA